MVSSQTVRSLENTFYEVYPRMVDRFNTNATPVVSFEVLPNYDGAAFAGDSTIFVGWKWFAGHLDDTEFQVHELFHLVQDYSLFYNIEQCTKLHWVVEGLADYARYTYGSPGWCVEQLDSTSSYRQGYKVTGAFFVWIEKQYDHSVMERLDYSLRSNMYDGDIFWKLYTGKSINELWALYANVWGLRTETASAVQ